MEVGGSIHKRVLWVSPLFIVLGDSTNVEIDLMQVPTKGLQFFMHTIMTDLRD
jgi:hypothetical protein